MPSKCLRDAFEMFLPYFVDLFFTYEVAHARERERESWNRKVIEEIIFNFTP